MTLTRIDCHFHRGEAAVAETSSYVAINPGQVPGSLVVGGAWAVREGIGSQVASKLALEHFVVGVLKYFDSGKKYEALEGEESPTETSLQVLETAFRSANDAVFNFGTKLSAGGRMSASLIGLVIEGSILAAARAGGGCAYLSRTGEVFPFFEDTPKTGSDPALGYYIGAQSAVAVELASVAVQERDVVFVFPCILTEEQEGRLKEAAQEIDFTLASSCGELCRRVFIEFSGALSFAVASRIGPEAIYLSSPIDQLSA